MRAQDDILEYYRRELSYLRTQGVDFAARYPKVAQRLLLSGAESPDPHTERLIEAVAFLSARVHRDMDREFPTVASALLDNLCPVLTQPVPSMTVVQMTLDPSQGKVTSGLKVPRGVGMSTTAMSGENCRFQLAWDLTLWPLRCIGVRHEDRMLHIEFAAEPGVDVGELQLDTLRVHLAGELLVTMPLQELLTASVERVEIRGPGGKGFIRGAQVEQVGFAENESVLPQPDHAHPAYGLLVEYFAFPRKFQFFDVHLREAEERARGEAPVGLLGTGASFTVTITFDHASRVLSQLTAENFRLGCAPAVNLFPLTGEPIRMDRRKYEYLLVPDYQREATTEVHSVVGVSATDPRADRPVRIPSVFTAGDEHEPAQLYWTARREASLRKDITGTDVFLSFVDGHEVHTVPDYLVVYAQTLCTNRRLAEQLSPGARFFAEGVSTSTRVRALYTPSSQREPVLGAQALWKLVSLLRLNHRSLVDGTNGAETLRNMLMLFAGEGVRDQAHVRGITGLTAHRATAHIGADNWRGHVRGTDVVLEFDPDSFVGNSPLLLAGVLARFFALYTTINSFVRVAVDRGGERWMQYPAMSGRQWLL
ncbi:type VI secretion system baseplate subunit TssF [Ramlibacter albus]|uniref:Type VI secretion system baseplate subunit TssF n=1 Tax=Ramlibacter albus TaxID=2079448 RepID=A0A923M6Z3_9BURK|nr:type VI secretion system baseplate subunit TssF [Ramlibacter albus]MBC5764500.1 type VI secretion system baseplate subunit TssF [Ramlibacter albus]